MWFAKLFGGRDEHDQYEEPTAVPPVRPAAQNPTTSVTKRPAATPSAVSDTAKRKGFDPYNSGSFERRNAWERVIRR
jgi:hypothetical protein